MTCATQGYFLQGLNASSSNAAAKYTGTQNGGHPKYVLSPTNGAYAQQPTACPPLQERSPGASN